MNCYDLTVTADMTPTPPPSSKRTAHGRETMTQLPLVRVKRIIKVDRDIQKCGNEAAVLITRATVRVPFNLGELISGIVCAISC